MLVFTISMIAGIIPALYLSSFQPALILKGKKIQKSKYFNLKNSLIVAQFFVSIVLLATTLLVSKQKNYMLNKKLGFDKEQILYIPIKGEIRANYISFKEELLKLPEIKIIISITYSHE